MTMGQNKSGVGAAPRIQNIPIRTDLGAQLRATLRKQRPLPRVLYSDSYSNLEAQIFARYCQKFTRRDP